MLRVVTKEMVVDFRRDKLPPSPLHIGGAAVEIISSYSYLGVHLTENLTWSSNTSCLVKKAHPRLYFLRRLRCAGLGSSVLSSSYRCAMESVLCSCITVWPPASWKTSPTSPLPSHAEEHREQNHQTQEKLLYWGRKTVEFWWFPLSPPAAPHHRLHQFNCLNCNRVVGVIHEVTFLNLYLLFFRSFLYFYLCVLLSTSFYVFVLA